MLALKILLALFRYASNSQSYIVLVFRVCLCTSRLLYLNARLIRKNSPTFGFPSCCSNNIAILITATTLLNQKSTVFSSGIKMNEFNVLYRKFYLIKNEGFRRTKFMWFKLRNSRCFGKRGFQESDAIIDLIEVFTTQILYWGVLNWSSGSETRKSQCHTCFGQFTEQKSLTSGREFL